MSPLPEKPLSDSRSSVGVAYLESHEFSQEERRQLLNVAHNAIQATLEEREIALQLATPHLSERRGVFTTLYIHGELRGCVGYVFPTMPLAQAVAESARSAAFGDTRFPPVATKEESEELKISLSVLSTLKPIRAEDVEVGRHGLLVSKGGCRGLLLPQVPVEHHWNRETFLDQTCKKAGLPHDAWRQGATLEAFTAEVFGDVGIDP